jgi:carbohydrate kinase (thermoresistant glucokinase family)
VGTVFVVMGVSGCGKSLIGEKLAIHLKLNFVEGDDFHSVQNKQKMANGIALNDHDRYLWLKSLNQILTNSTKPMIVACSALKRSYRAILRDHNHKTIFIHLDGSREVLKSRLDGRKDHFFSPSLLDDQLSTLEILDSQENGFVVNIDQEQKKIIAEIETTLNDMKILK